MKKILLLCAMLTLSSILQAAVYVFTTNEGIFRFNNKLNTVSFKGVNYKITEYNKLNSESDYIVCEANNATKLFILNFSNDNIIEYDYIETFEWKDVALYNKTELISGLYRNINTYIYNNNIKGDKATSFRQYANIMIEGIKTGTITMKGDGTFTDSTGKLSSSGTFDKNLLGKKKNTQNNILNLVADYILDYIKQLPTCDSNWKQIGKPYMILKAEKFE